MTCYFAKGNKINGKPYEETYYFFDYLFWLGEITWENYHKVNFKQPRGSDMLWACNSYRFWP